MQAFLEEPLSLLAVMFNAAHQASHQTVKLLFLQDVKLWSFSSSKPSTSELLYLACCQAVELCTTSWSIKLAAVEFCTSSRSMKLALQLTVSFKCTERTEWIIVQHLRWPFLLLANRFTTAWISTATPIFVRPLSSSHMNLSSSIMMSSIFACLDLGQLCSPQYLIVIIFGN